MAARREDLGKSFARHLRAEGKAERTIILYGMSVRFTPAGLRSRTGRPTLDKAAIREWLAQLADTHEPGTVRTRHRGLRRFCGWLVDEGELDANPMGTLSPPAAPAKPVPVLSDDGAAWRAAHATRAVCGLTSVTLSG